MKAGTSALRLSRLVVTLTAGNSLMVYWVCVQSLQDQAAALLHAGQQHAAAGRDALPIYRRPFFSHRPFSSIRRHMR